MKTTSLRLAVLAALFAAGASLQPARAGTYSWLGTSGTDLLWPTPANWSPAGPPGTGDTALFGNSSVTNNSGAIAADNFLQASKTILSLQYTNNTGSHNTLLSPGVTLTVSNSTGAGDALVFSGSIGVNLTNSISGPGAALWLTNTTGNINLHSASTSSTGPYIQDNTLDLSGLDTFHAGIARVLVAGDGGSGNPVSREVGTLVLAKTNIIVASGTAPAINVGDNVSNGAGGNNDPTVITSRILLGETNAISADTITIGREKAAGVMMFNPAFTNGATPTLYLRGASGTRVTTFSLADDSALASSNQRDNGIADFTGGSVNAMIGTAYIALGKNGNNTATAASEMGTLTFSLGTVDVNTLNIGCADVASSTGIGPIGTVNVNGSAILAVNTALNLAKAGATPSTPSQGILNVNGGTLTIKGSVVNGGGSSMINFNGGTLNATNTGIVIGTLTSPISSIAFTNATLNLTPSFLETNLEVAALNIGGGNSTVNITALPAITNYPAQFPLIGFSAATGPLGSIALGTLPATSPAYQGSLANDGVSQVYLVLTTGPVGTPPPAPKAVVWNGVVSGAPNGNWDAVTTNWVSSGVPTNYANITSAGAGDYVTFDDTLRGTTAVNLTTTLTPGSLNFNNNNSNYVFSGSGKLSGATGLIKNGSGTLILAESGGDNFSGGLAVSNGVVVIDDDSSGVTGGTVINSNAVVQVGNDDANGVLPTGGITNNGALVFDRNNNSLSLATAIAGAGAVTNNGPGTVTFTAIETYTGPTVVNAGTLAFTEPNGGNSGIYASSSLTINSGATVVVNSDNSLSGSTGKLPIFINAGGKLTGLGTADGGTGASSHLAGLLTLNGGTLTDGGTQLIPGFGTWGLQGGVAVPGGPITSTINCLDVIPAQAGGTTFDVTNGTTAADIDLLVSGTLIKGTSLADTGITLNGNGVTVFDANNTYAAGTTVNGGTLQLGMTGDAAALVSPLGTGNVTLNNSGTTLKLACPFGVTINNSIGDDSASDTTVLAIAGTNYLGGSDSCSGATIVNTGALVVTAGGSINNSSAMSVANATLDVSASSSQVSSSGSLSLTNSIFNLGPNVVSSLNSLALSNSTVIFNAAAGAPGITLSGSTGLLTTGGKTNLIVLTAVPGFPSYPASFPIIKYQSADPNLVDVNNRLTSLGVKLPASGHPLGYLTNDVANNSIDLVLLGGAAPLLAVTWTGVPNGNWNLSGTSNWVTTSDGVTPYIYQDGADVTFDDSATGTTTVNLTTTLSPGSVDFNNATLTYTLTGTGSLSGQTGLTNSNSGTVVLAESGGDNYLGGITVNNGTVIIDNNSSGAAGGVTINAGTVQVGNNDANGFLPAGLITDNGALIFNQITNAAVANAITGTGTLTQNDTNILSLGGVSPFTGAVNVLAGTLQVNNNAALGNSTTTTVTNSATLDLGGPSFAVNIVNLTNDLIVVSGAGINTNGAIVNNSTIVQQNALHLVVLAGDTTFGGTGRWDMRNTGGPASLTCNNGNPYNLTKVGANQVSLVNVTVDPNLANITVKAGTFAIQGTTTLGNPTNTITMYSNTLLHTAGFSTALAKVIDLTNAAIDSTGVSLNTVAGPVTLTGSNSFSTTDPLTFGVAIGGSGGVYKFGVSNLIFSAANTYTGPTVINAGTLALIEPAALSNSASISIAAGALLDVSGRNDQTLTVVGGETLAGAGSVNGSLTNDAGSSFFIGGVSAIGTFTVSSVAALQGTTYVAITNNGALFGALDAGSVVFGGTLVVSNLDNAHPLAAGESFQLFNATSYSGMFTGIVPAVPGANLAWNTTNLYSSGKLAIVSTLVPQPRIASVVLSGTSLVFNGTGGTSGGNYEVLTSTNLTSPLSQWTTNASRLFDGSGNFSFTNSINPSVKQQFYMLKTP